MLKLKFKRETDKPGIKSRYLENGDLLYYRKLTDEIDKHSRSVMPLFILHTSPLDSNYMYNSATLDYKSNIPTYFVDLPSHGKSPDMKINHLCFRKMADELDNLRISLGFDKICILGHGIGGFIAQYYAAYHRKHVLGLILVNTSPNHTYHEDMAWNIRERYNRTTQRSFYDKYGRIEGQSLLEKFVVSLAFHFPERNISAAKELMDSIDRFPEDVYKLISNQLIPTLDLRYYNQQIKHPVLIISGKYDVWPKRTVEMFHIDIPKADFAEFETGHFPMIEKSQDFWMLIQNWMHQLISKMI